MGGSNNEKINNILEAPYNSPTGKETERESNIKDVAIIINENPGFRERGKWRERLAGRRMNIMVSER